MSLEPSSIRVKAMLIAPNDDYTAHVVSVNAPTLEDPNGFHRLIGGSVELGETHRDAIEREVAEELQAEIQSLTYLGVVENFFHSDGVPGHEVVFLYTGILDPAPAAVGATLTEIDGSVLPVVWRPFHEADPPLYPYAARAWVDRLAPPHDGPAA